MSPTKTRDAVIAAGCIVWRARKGTIEVLLVHMVRDDVWAWPKGKVDPGEHLVVCAQREVREETGYLVNLAQPLPGAVYTLPDGRRKVVHYWSAQVRARVRDRPQNMREIDEIAWVTLDEADAKLTRRSDQTQLDAVRRMHEKGTLVTSPIVIQRHAQARPRKKWAKGEETRPLTAKGRGQAKDLVKVLSVYGVGDVVTSPWARCTLTVEPYVKASAADLRTMERLTEAAHAENPGKVANSIGRFIERAKPVIICLHRPVLPTVIEKVREYCDRSVVLDLPRRDPYLAAGEMLVAHVTREGRVTAIERHSA
ncbi:NUDIX hydrolase [Micrococcales bacterium 31B]|nr:NUDIX hydrolase [Micrococcales bacterium 31B]